MRSAAFIAFIASELGFLALAHVLGGPAWTALGVLACVAQVGGGLRPAALAPLVPALVWAVAAKATDNRELYFPFAMHLAAATAAVPGPAHRVQSLAAGGVVAAAFLAIRCLQDATPTVLGVESVAAAAVLFAAVVARERFPGPLSRWWIPPTAAVLALACLAL